MSDLTPRQARARLSAWLRGSGPGSLRGALMQAGQDGAVTIAGVASAQFMRDAKGEGRRRASDRGRLRIVTGTLARAVASPDGVRGSIRQVKAEGTGGSLAVRITQGVVLSVAPGGYNENRTARSGVSLSFLRPAAQAARPRVGTRAGSIVKRSFTREVAGR